MKRWIILTGFLLATASAVQADEPDPSKMEVMLPAAGGWNATLVYRNDVGIWTCGTVDAFPGYGARDAFGLDDKGRCILLAPYSGKWAPYQTVHDHEWLGALAAVDLDPRCAETEIYTGGKRGNLYRIVVHADNTFDTARIAAFPGEEIHTAVGGDLDPARPGQELLVFTNKGNVYDVQPDGPGIGFRAPLLATLGGRVRQALVLEAGGEDAPRIAAVMRSGEVRLLRRGPRGLKQRTLLKEDIGFGRCAQSTDRATGAPVLYVTRDDGCILRLQADEHLESWAREMIYAGPQGPRGIAAGRFDADPEVETVAVFGYSKKVELLSRSGDEPWRAETLFEDLDKGHWLAAVETDGRNGTQELMGSGYGSRIFILTRPPGYGVEGDAAQTTTLAGKPACACGRRH